MPSSCAVRSCKNVHSKSENIHFYNFPKNCEMRKQWAKFCEIADKKRNLEYLRVCSEHFVEDDFENFMRHKLMGGKLLLKSNAVPSIAARTVKSSKSNPARAKSATHSTRCQMIVEKNLVDNILSNSETMEDEGEESELVEVVVSIDMECESLGSPGTNQQDFMQYESTSPPPVPSAPARTPALLPPPSVPSAPAHTLAPLPPLSVPSAPAPACTPAPPAPSSANDDLLTRRIIQLEEERNQLKLEIENLRRKEIELKNKFHLEKQMISVELDKKYTNILSKCFTKTQIDVLKEDRVRVTWTEIDVVNALALYEMSRQCYIYLRNTLHYPLPGLSTLTDWALKLSKLSITYGVFHEILKLISVAAKSMTELEKIVVLQFDEIKVAERYEHNQQNYTNHKRHEYAQVIEVRSLMGKWKQPVYCEFDQKVTKEILMGIITKLYEIDITVVACVSNCSPSNADLWNSLGVNETKSWINHPDGSGKIFFFANAPLLLKLLRDQLLDTGFLWSGEVSITKEPLISALKQKMLSNPKFKCTPSHIECNSSLGLKVSRAAELLSNSVSEALSSYTCEGETFEQKSHRENLSTFIKITNDWFDVMNSYSTDDYLPLKHAYGNHVYVSKQNDALEKMYKMIAESTCIGKEGLQVFQSAILMSINSLRLLFLHLKEKFEISHMMTCKLNLDALDNLFERLRALGGIKNHPRDPTPANLLNHLRWVMLRKSTPLWNMTNEEFIVVKTVRSVKSSLGRLSAEQPDHFSEVNGDGPSKNVSAAVLTPNDGNLPNGNSLVNECELDDVNNYIEISSD